MRGADIIVVEELIDGASLSPLQVTTFALCAGVALFDGYDIGTISSMAPLIAEHFHVSVRSFGPLFSIGFIGMMLGAFALGAAADRVGRKWTIVGSTFVFGFFTAVIAAAPTPHALLTLRFLAGVGLGGTLPNLIALTAEYAPLRARTLIVTLLSAGITLGGALAPLIGAYIGPHWGWQASFLIGGGLPLIACVLLAVSLPESLRFLVVRRRPLARIRALIERIDPALAPRVGRDDVTIVVGEVGEEQTRISVAELFRHGRLLTTLLLWAVFFCTLLTALFIVSWLPAVLRASGLRVSSALVLASLLSAGGILAAPVLGRLVDRLGPYRVLIPTYVAAAALTACVGRTHGFAPLALAIAADGFFIFGAQACIQALAASLYPTAIRAAGVGWAFGVGRLGSILGPLLGGTMLQMHWTVSDVFLAAALPALIAALGTLAMWMRATGPVAGAAGSLRSRPG